jgi:hypothetical protein
MERYDMLRKTERKAEKISDRSFENQFNPAVSKRVNDEMCLDAMRSIVKEFISYRQENPTDMDAKHSYKNRYESYHQQISDDSLKAYTSFELMEKLYWQEYLVRE